MKTLQRKILEQLVHGSAEPLLVARIDQPDWPVVLCNPAFDALAGDAIAVQQPFADVVEAIIGRDLALEVSESVRANDETSFPVEVGGKEYLLALRPLALDNDANTRFCAAYWRAGSGVSGAADQEAQQALLKAKRRIRDLSRDDPVTGLLNARAFNEVLEHDWAVAAREHSKLALVAFSLHDFDQYIAVFGRHAADSCLRRVSQAIRRFLRRASDVAAHINHKGTDYLMVLSHSSDEEGVNEFAIRIAAAVRELRLHHPRSSEAKFVTVAYSILVTTADQKRSGGDFLKETLQS